jgi:hypothetical protein
MLEQPVFNPTISLTFNRIKAPWNLTSPNLPSTRGGFILKKNLSEEAQFLTKAMISGNASKTR